MGAINISIFQGEKELKKLAQRLTSVEITREVNRIPVAELVLWDGDFAKQQFELSSDIELELGKPLSIKMDYVQSENGQTNGAKRPPVFSGLIIKQIVDGEADFASGGSHLTLELKSKTYLMSLRRRTRVFRNKRDSDIFKEIIEAYGLQVGTLEETQPKHPELVQYNATDWDFLLSRADHHGLWVLPGIDTDGNEIVNIVQPEITDTPEHTFTVGLNAPPIFSFEMEADVSNQCEKVESFSWDSNKQKITRLLKAKDFELAQGNFKVPDLAKSIGGTQVAILSHSESDPTDLQSWADAFLRKSRLSLFKGRLSTSGKNSYGLNQTIEIVCVGDRFNGRTLITGIRQSADLNGWTTDVQFGLSSGWFTQQPGISGASADGLLPAINGLHLGVVETYEQDLEHKLLVKVRLPLAEGGKKHIWARLASPYAGKNHGLFFRPEVGDEVLLGFIDNNPRQAVILGMLYGKQNYPPLDNKQITASNKVKTWASKGGIRMTWDEAVPSWQVVTEEGTSANGQSTPKTQVFLGKDSVEISDLNGNMIKMDVGGITIKSPKAVKIEGPKVDVN